MDLRIKYLTDKLVGGPLVAALNLSAYLLGKVLRRNHSLAGTNTIVICKLLGLGSIVQITPLLVALRQAFPDAKIVFLTRRANVAYCQRINVIDQTLAVDDKTLASLVTSVAAAVYRLLRWKVDLFINLEVYSNIGALLAVTSSGRNRLGYYMSPRDQRARGIYTHMVYFNRSAPVGDVYLQAARCLGISVIPHGLLPPRVDAADQSALGEKLRTFGVAEGPYVVVNPNSSALSHERRWPTQRFAESMLALHRHHPELQFLIIGGPGEEATGAELRAQLPPAPDFPATDLSGRLSLVDLMALLCMAKVLLTNDSGPMHLAFSLAVPTVALFGPVSPEHYGGGEGGPRVLFYHHLYCSPCVHHFLDAPCGGDNQCMKSITSAEVVAAIEAVMAGRQAPVGEAALRYCDRDVVFGAHRRSDKKAGADR